jgi:hypothetical protein
MASATALLQWKEKASPHPTIPTSVSTLTKQKSNASDFKKLEEACFVTPVENGILSSKTSILVIFILIPNFY